MTSDTCSLVLSGLDGSNPLGFLAAVGALRTATLAESSCDWRMKWISRDGIWAPELLSSRDTSPTGFVELLASVLKRPTPEFDFEMNLTVTPERFRAVTRRAQCCASARQRGHADFLAAFGCDAFATNDGKIQDTALRTMSGAGNQHFLGTMQQLARKTDAKDLHRSLFAAWDYSDRKLGLRWDPQEDRRYALRWDNPTAGNGVPTMHGANRLAVEALPLFATAPVGLWLETTGFMRPGRRFSWPIWACPIGMEVVRSALSMTETQLPQPDRSALHAVGIVEVFRSQRFTVDNYRNFTIAHAP